MAINLLKRLIGLGLISIFVVVPLAFYPNLIYPLGSIKTVVFQILIEITFFLWLGLAYLDKNVRPKMTPLKAAISLFLLIVTISAVLGSDPLKSFWGSIDEGIGILSLWHFFALFLVISSFAHEFTFRAFALTNVTTGVVVSLLGFMQRFLWWPGKLAIAPLERTYSTFSNSPFLAAYLIFVLFLTWWLFYAERKFLVDKFRNDDLVRALMGGLTILFITTVFLTQTRGAIIAVAAGTAFLILNAVRRGSYRARVVILISLALITFLVGIFIKTHESPFWAGIPTLNRFVSPTLEENFKDRVVLWDVGLKAFFDKPLLGWGWRNFDIAFWHHYNPTDYTINYVFTKAPDKPFNVLMEYLVNTGVLGLLAYFIVLIMAVYLLYWRKFPRGDIITALLITYLVQNLVLFDTIATYPVFFALLAFIDSYGEDGNNASSPKTSKNKILLIFLIAISIGLLVAYKINGRLISILNNHYYAVSYSDINFASTIPYWQKLITTDIPYNHDLVVNYAENLRRAFRKDQKDADWQSLGKGAIAKLENLVTERKGDAETLNQLAKTYIAFRAFDKSYLEKSEMAIEKARALAPYYPEIYLTSAKANLIKGLTKEADLDIAYAKKLNPAISDPQVIKAIIYKRIGNSREAIKIMNRVTAQGIWPKYAEENDALGDLYLNIKDYDKAIEFYSRALSVPTVKSKRLIINSTLKLGIAYRLTGNRQMATKLFEGLLSNYAKEPIVLEQLIGALKLLGYQTTIESQ